MASYPAERIAFTPYTSVPATLDTSTAVSLFLLSAVEVFFYISAGAGDVYLLKWVKEANTGNGRWYRYQNPISVDFASHPDWHGRWVADKDTPSYYQLLLPAGVTVTEAFMQGIRVG
jgi:hypothetical protein